MKAIITVGLGYGDEGKGSIVDALVRHHDSRLVVRYSGGCQCGHHVVLPDGRWHCFSQFGSGTLAGAKTYIDRDVIIDPIALHYEAEHLKILGINSPYSLLTINPNCLITTPYHRLINRAKAASNTCGLGIGETRRLWLHYNAALRIKDLMKKKELDILWRIREIYETECYENDLKCELPSPYDVLKDLRKYYYDVRCSDELNIHDDLTVIFEGAQGMLLNQDQPNGTWSDVTPRNAVQLCKSMEIPFEIMGVTRTYLTRHGGHLEKTFDKWRPQSDHNVLNYQGTMEFGPLNLDLLKKSSVRAKIDSVAINHYDQNRDVKYHNVIYVMKNRLDVFCSILGHGPTHKDKTIYTS